MSNDSLCFLTCLVFVTTVAAISLVNAPALDAINALSKTIDFCKAEDAIQDVIHATSKYELWAAHVPAVQRTSFVSAVASTISNNSARSAGVASSSHPPSTQSSQLHNPAAPQVSPCRTLRNELRRWRPWATTRSRHRRAPCASRSTSQEPSAFAFACRGLRKRASVPRK